jgi:photosystem II stability/assembly factor-like uncharacterized protein
MNPDRISHLTSRVSFAFLVVILLATIIAPTKVRNGSAFAKGAVQSGIAAVAAVSPSDVPGAQKRVWQMTGPFGGDVVSLAIDPRNSDVILIGTKDGQLFRSTDGGGTWRRLKPGVSATGYSLSTILFDSSRAGSVFVGAMDASGGGVYFSDNSGESWIELAGMRNRPVLSMVQAANDPRVLAIASRDGIYRTKDRGASWAKITPDNDPELRNFHSVAIDPRDADTLYAGTTHLPWKTTDGGQTWRRAGSKESGMIDDSDIFAIHIDEENPDVVLMSACSGIYRSNNASKQWVKIQGIPSTSRRTHVIFQHPARGNVLFAGTTEGLWRTTESGNPESWSRVTPLRLVINAVAVHRDRPDRILLGTDDYGVLISNDGGESYEPSNAGFISRQVKTVVADRTQRSRVYAGVLFDGANGGFFVSEDGGITWQQSMRGMGVRDVYSLLQSGSQPQTLFAGTNHGVFRSDDHGRAWAKVKKEEPAAQAPATTEVPPPTPLAAPPAGTRPRTTAPRVVTPVVKTQTKKSSGKSTSKSTAKKTPARAPQRSTQVARKPQPAPPLDDGFVNLESQVFQLASLYPDSPDAQEGLLAGTWDGLFVTTDEKKGWKPMKIVNSEGSVLTKAPINALATHPQAPKLLWIGTEEGLFVSKDAGNSFVRLILGEDADRIKAIVFDPRKADTVFVGTTVGFFLTNDGGRKFERRGGGMPEVIEVSAIEVSSANPDDLYLGDSTHGTFYASHNSGRNWESVDIGSLPSRRIFALATDPFDRNRLYAGSFSGGIYVLSRQGDERR